MFLKAVVFVCYFGFIFIASSAVLLKKIVAKRSDIDLQTCIENFDVHKDKIIRTQDSKDMGAKYINEIDLGTREECLRLCCETENCDVFVFEEKNSGSCYLFQCGPPEDFKCKFTHHANYSSAILAVNRHLPDLESQIKLTKHEQDLTKLSYRKPESATEMNAQKMHDVKTTMSTTAATETKILPIPATNHPPEQNKEVKCSRYQFECRSTKECIAIYNACDGIPQCADGSDEARELGCPETGTTQTATRIHQNNPMYEDVPINQNRPINPQQFSNTASQKLYQTPVQQREQPNAQILNVPRPDSDFLRPPDSRNAFIPHSPPYDHDPPHGPSYPQIPPQSQNSWISHQPNQIPQQYQQFEDRNSHIFNHKENGLQVSEGQDIRYNKHKGAMQTLHRALGYSSAGQTQYGEMNGRENPKIVSYFDDMYRQNPQYQEKWAKNNPDDRFNNRNQYVPETNQNTRENWQQQNLVQADDSEKTQYYNHSPPDQTATWKSESEKQAPEHHDHEKIAHELKHSKELMENVNKNKENKQIKIEKVQKHTNHDHVQYAKMTQYKVAEVLDLQDGIAETPGGAVLSLTLGLIITCIMALLIGCRLRVVRRRIRRGGKSYAHDADYLVNGMYL